MLNERPYMRWFSRPPDDYRPGDQCGPGWTGGEIARLAILKHRIEQGRYADDCIDVVTLRRLQFARWLVARGIITDAGTMGVKS